MTTPNNADIHALINAAKIEINARFLEWADSLNQCGDNPNIIKRAGQSFKVSSSSIETSWDPFYHDWKSQYLRVHSYLEHAMTHASARSALASIAKNGKVYDTQGTHNYHPEVLKHVQPLAEAVSQTVRLWHLDTVSSESNLKP